MRKNAKSVDFGKWFANIVNSYPEIKKKAIANKAGISPVSFSRILSGEQGASPLTAEKLMKALNDLLGAEIVKVSEGLKLLTEVNESFSQKLKETLAASSLFTNFNEADFDWIAELIEMRVSWKNSQKLRIQTENSLEPDNFYLPPSFDIDVKEPTAIKIEDINSTNIDEDDYGQSKIEKIS